MNKRYIYSEEFENLTRKYLAEAESKGRVNVKEVRNFIDFDLIPLVVVAIKNTNKKGNNDE